MYNEFQPNDKNPLNNFLPKLSTGQLYALMCGILLALGAFIVWRAESPVNTDFDWSYMGLQNFWQFLGLLAVVVGITGIVVYGPMQEAGWVGRKKSANPRITGGVVGGLLVWLIAFITLVVLVIKSI
jgi:hypothetical protein